MISRDDLPDTPDWQPEPHEPPEFASLLRGMEQAAAGLTARRDDLLDDPEWIVRGTN